MAYDEAEAVFDAIFDGEDLAAAAQARKLAVITTDFFDRQGPEKAAGNRAQFAQAAFELPVGDVSEIKDLGDGYYLIQPIEDRPARIPELDEVIEDVKADLIARLQREAAAEDARAALAGVKTGKELATVASALGLKPQSTGYFKRDDAIAGIGRESAVAAVAFTLSQSSRWPDDVVETGKGFYLIEFENARAADLTELAGQKDAIRQRLLQQKQYRAVEAWLDSRKAKSEISIEPNFREG
jgi:peptidyl-prolyl cis-trans isomerase D